jgi:hypothetical protein
MADEIVPAGPIKPPVPAVTEITPAGQIKPPGQEPEATWGETAVDMGKAALSGVGRGASQLVGLPGTLSDLFNAGVTKAGKAVGIIPESWNAPEKSFLSGEAVQGKLSDVTGGASEYRGKTTAGKYAGTVGEFLPGAIVGPGSLARNVVTGGVLPALASEAAGQAVEGSSSPWAEPAARFAGAILGGVGANALEGMGRRAISPTGGADPTRLAMAKTLEDAGVPVTAGQKTGSESILSREADTAAGQAFANASPDSPQMKAFTAAAMKTIGSNADVASEAAMNAAQKDIVNRMQSAVAGVDVRPTLPLMDALSKARQGYFANTNPAVRPPIIEDIIKDVASAARSGNAIPADVMAAWRTNLGQHLYSNDNFVSDAAHAVRSALDDAIENSMVAIGQPDRMSAWRQARDQYRNYLAIAAAIKPSMERGVIGVITPKDLMSSVARQDKSGVVTGRRGEISDLAKAGIAVAKPLPAPRSGQTLRRLAPLGEAAASIPAALGAVQAAQFMGLGPAGTALTTGLAVGAPIVDAARRAVMQKAMNPSVQKYLSNQLVNRSAPSSAIPSAASGAITSAGAQADGGRVGRKSGGRVGGHEAAADQLVRAAERAKRDLGRSTEPLLSQSDDTVAHALEVANRSI